MSNKKVIRDKRTVAQKRKDEKRGWVVDETPELRRSVEQEIQGKVDTNHPDSCRASMTLAQEEEAMARDIEIARTRARVGEQIEMREAGSRHAVQEARQQARERFDERAASVDRWQDPAKDDPREMLSQSNLAMVNRQAARLAEQLDGWTRAAISRRLAERVADGRGMTDAVVDVYDELDQAAGTVIPIAKVGEVNRGEVSIEGRVAQLWDPSSPTIQNVGLLEDESGRTRVTIWKASEAPWIEEGDKVRIHGASVNWYEGRASLAVTGWSSIHFPERGRWWE
ncbi:OB-fold nucleic acid binding domain-containing protein [Haloarcula sp. H-GB4]|uniref:OB-fold nucleic acid binding domain-containing protein n=1 Tax=Haloarcula sp. H-GB4 TaxID=3069755 RepID=UPI0027AE29AD|nr:OB-fold nucleic acid binding domain-containing protein [Haloarcula sp. H-GB4]MDQ2072375.1 OB-fold nucleic acid binding domain-containing protein [Haloarcula sp. H-GB4]